MTKEKRLQFRLSEEDFARLEAYAKKKDVSMAQVLREYVKHLPKPVG
jgi:predicted DNA-binding protein